VLAVSIIPGTVLCNSQRQGHGRSTEELSKDNESFLSGGSASTSDAAHPVHSASRSQSSHEDGSHPSSPVADRAGRSAVADFERSPEKSACKRRERKIAKRRQLKGEKKRMTFNKNDPVLEDCEWRVHEGQKQFKCNLCASGWRFQDAQACYQHVGMQPDSTKSFLVKVPGKQCRYDLNLAKRDEHKKIAAHSALLYFTCGLCCGQVCKEQMSWPHEFTVQER
jgi:hypothetical protein